jgi:hypothetical protein
MTPEEVHFPQRRTLASLQRLLESATGDSGFSDGYRFGLEEAIELIKFQAELEAIIDRLPAEQPREAIK